MAGDRIRAHRQRISWCKQNEMYAILDLHAAPGGHYDAAISTDPSSRPSGERENRNKMAACGSASRRSMSTRTVAGYDLLNEPNWDLPN